MPDTSFRPAMNRRSLLSGFAATLGAVAVGTPITRPRAALQQVRGPAVGPPQPMTFEVPFGRNGIMGGSKDAEAYLDDLVKAAIAPPLSDINIYAHGWLTGGDDLMVTYDTVHEGFSSELRRIAADMRPEQAGSLLPAPPLTLPTSVLLITTHWPSRRSESGPIGIADIVSFSTMEARANLVGRTGMAHLIRLVAERLLADPDLASTRLLLYSHSFGSRVFASALSAFAVQAPDVFAALQTRNRITLIMLEPAMPADVLDPNTLTQAHPYAPLAYYQNLRILTTMSQWDLPLIRFYPAQEAQQPADEAYALAPAGTRAGVSALGGAGPSDATWRAFNGNLPRAHVSVGPRFTYGDILPYVDHRLVVADLTRLHAAHRRDDMARPANERPPFGRPDKRSGGFTGYHNDIYNREIYQLAIGFAFGQHGLPGPSAHRLT